MIIGLDIGYNAVKVCKAGAVRKLATVSAIAQDQMIPITEWPETAQPWPAVSQETATWAGRDPGFTLEYNDRRIMVGDRAIEYFGEWQTTAEDQNWHRSAVYADMIKAALAMASNRAYQKIHAVVGLPIAAYRAGLSSDVVDVLTGRHTFKIHGRPFPRQTVDLDVIRVIPQPYGGALAMVIDDHGQVNGRAVDRFGVIDAGSNNTQVLTVSRMQDIPSQTRSIDYGAWDICRAVAEWIARELPGLDLTLAEIAGAIRLGKVDYFGDPVTLAPILDRLLPAYADRILGMATGAWGVGARLSAIGLVGGGQYMIGPYLRERFQNAEIVGSDPESANVIGFYRFGQYLGRRAGLV